jgi:hypothetical protein
MVDPTTTTPLNLKDVLNRCILPHFKSFFLYRDNEYTVLLRFALFELNSFCESTTNDWTTIITTMSDLPAVLYCSPETYLVYLSDIIALRFLHNERQLIKLQDWESTLKIVNSFSVIIEFGLRSSKPDDFPLLNQFFAETLYNYGKELLEEIFHSFLYSCEFLLGWKSQLLWYNITRAMTNKQPIKIPNAFFRITGALDDVFIVDNTQQPIKATTGLEGWYDLFTACRISTRLTNELFEVTLLEYARV